MAVNFIKDSTSNNPNVFHAGYNSLNPYRYFLRYVFV